MWGSFLYRKSDSCLALSSSLLLFVFNSEKYYYSIVLFINWHYNNFIVTSCRPKGPTTTLSRRTPSTAAYCHDTRPTKTADTPSGRVVWSPSGFATKWLRLSKEEWLRADLKRLYVRVIKMGVIISKTAVITTKTAVITTKTGVIVIKMWEVVTKMFVITIAHRSNYLWIKLIEWSGINWPQLYWWFLCYMEL